MRKLAMAAKREDTLQKACAAVGVPVPAAKPADGGQCFELHSVHGVLDCDFPHLGGKALEKAPPDDPKELCFLVYGTFAATGHNGRTPSSSGIAGRVRRSFEFKCADAAATLSSLRAGAAVR